jgi:hypothetical protein
MKYLLLIYGPEPTSQPTPEEIGQEIEAYNAFGEHARQRGAFIAGEALQPTVTATTVRVRDGQTLTTDGPFAETKESLGGYYLVEANDLDDAIDIAARIPGAQRGSIEVRPIVDFEAMMADPAAAASAAN